MPAYLGMRHTEAWTDPDNRPKDWRDLLLYLYPNHKTMLTGLMAKMAKEKTVDPEFYWWSKKFPVRVANVTAGTSVFTNAALTVPYAGGGVALDVLYIEVSDADIIHFRIGQEVSLQTVGDYRNLTVGKVTGIDRTPGAAYLQIELLADDPGFVVDGITGLIGVDLVEVIGTINAEGSGLPNAISYEPIKRYNYTQIFKTPIEMTRTHRNTKVRWGSYYDEVTREALELHGVDMELAFIYGIPSERMVGGFPERTTAGLLHSIHDAGGLESNYKIDPDYAGHTWLASGEEWFDQQISTMMNWGQENYRVAFAGQGAILAINRLAKQAGHSVYTPTTRSYGIQVMEWTTAFGKIDLIQHPLLSINKSHSNTLICFLPQNLKERPLQNRDTQKMKLDEDGIDADREYFITETGLEFHHMEQCAILTELGVDNIL
jgi:hypothetical protein